MISQDVSQPQGLANTCWAAMQTSAHWKAHIQVGSHPLHQQSVHLPILVLEIIWQCISAEHMCVQTAAG